MDPTAAVQPVVDLIAAHPNTAVALIAVPALQYLSPFIAMIPGIWGGNTSDKGAGSGWSRFWRRFAALPIRLPGAK